MYDHLCMYNIHTNHIYIYIYTKSRGATAARQVVNEAFWQRPGMTGEGVM